MSSPEPIRVPRIMSYRQICELMEGRKLTDEEFEPMRQHALMVLDEIELKISGSDDIHKELEGRNVQEPDDPVQ